MAHPDDDQIVSAHLDEGTVHAWLDRQLPADDVARVESHVAACAACQAQVAEARGFIAASSRILTALDGVPARVVPERRRGVRLWHVRAAAAVLIVALGTATILRDARVPEFSPSRALTLSDSQRPVATSVAVNEADKPIAPSAAPQPAAVLSKKPVFREEARAPAVSKTAPSVPGRDESQGSAARDEKSTADAVAGVRRRAENKEQAAVSGVPAASPPLPSAAPAGVSGGAALQGAAPAAPGIAGAVSSPARAKSVQPRRLDAGAYARNSVTATDSVATSRPSRTTVTAPPPAAERDIAAKVADADRKNAQKPAAATSALGQSRLAGLTATACVGRTVTIASGVTDSDRQVVMATVQLESAPSTDSRYPGFALGTVGIDTGPPAGAWAPLGPDSAILSLPVEGPGAVSQAGGGNADSLAPDTLRDQPVVRRRVRCAPR